MSEPFEFVFPGRPVPWARPARGLRGKGKTPAKQLFHRRALAKAMQFAPGARSFGGGPVKLTVVFDYEANETRIRIEEVPSLGKAHRKGTADVDNLAKEVMEAAELAGLVADDVQVVSIHAKKWK